MPISEFSANRVNEIRWWHSIDLGNGIVTHGVLDTERQLKYCHLPERMDGMRVLDIGTANGWWAFLCEKRGAAEVVAIDTWQEPFSRDGFDVAKNCLRSRVNEFECDVLEIDPRYFGKFDLVLFLGVLYHIQQPLRALKAIRKVSNGTLILETHLDMLDVPRPACAWYEHGVDNDTTNWCGPNPECVLAWLRMTGFREPKMVGGEGLDIRGRLGKEASGARAAFHAHV